MVHGDILYDTEITNVRPFGIRQVVGPVKVHDQVHQFPRQGHFCCVSEFSKAVRQHGKRTKFAKDVLGDDGAVEVEAVAGQGHALLGWVSVSHGRRLHVLFGKARGADVRGRAPLVGHVVVPRHRVKGRTLDPVAADAGPPTQVVTDRSPARPRQGVGRRNGFEPLRDFLDDALALPTCQAQKHVSPDRVREVHFFARCRKKSKRRHRGKIFRHQMSAPVGLKNHGNTCFINAIEQCFRSVEYYMPPVAEAFATEEYPDLDQQDVHEYHMFVLMHLEETVPDFKAVFQGMFETRVEFPCGHANVHQEPFCELSIPLFPTFENMLESLESADKVTSSCDACGYQGTATKKTIVDRLPPFTVFHVKRFDYDFNKRDDPINVPTRWEFVRNGASTGSWASSCTTARA